MKHDPFPKPGADHKRMKPKPGKATAEQKRYWGWLSNTVGCIVSGERPATIHHVTSDKHGSHLSPRRTNWRVVPLAPRFHLIQFDAHKSIEGIGHVGFYKEHKICAYEASQRLLALYEALLEDAA